MPLTAKEQKDMLEEAFWIYYCCCFSDLGVRFDGNLDPLCAGTNKMCCFRSNAECGTGVANDMFNGLCGHTTKMCCLIDHFHLPPKRGHAGCTVCGQHLCGADSTGEEQALLNEPEKAELQDVNTIWKRSVKEVYGETFWLYHAFCMGCGVTKRVMNPLIMTDRKCIIQQQYCQTASPYTEQEGMCRSVGKNCCCVTHCDLPPRQGPVILCCDQALAGDKSKLVPFGSAKMPENEPLQQEM